MYVKHGHARCPEEGVLSPFFAVFDQYSWSHPSHCRHAASLFAEDGRHPYLLQICPHQFPPPPHSAARLMSDTILGRLTSRVTLFWGDSPQVGNRQWTPP